MDLKQLTIMVFYSLSLFLTCPASSFAGKSLVVAVAANFAPAMEEASELFTRKTGMPVQVTVSSSGRFYTQIRSGAPFDLFFSADRKRPQLLFEEEHCDEPVEYVKGSVVFWSRDTALCNEATDWQSAVSGLGLKKIGMANPELAPYGAATRQALEEENLWYPVQKRLVFGANVGQSFQYAATGATAGSFIALSLARTPTGNKGCSFPVPEAKPVSQGACIIRATKNRSAAQQFLEFMSSDEIKIILHQYGYMEAGI